MTQTWSKRPAGEVTPGDTVRTSHGFILEVTRIEAPFLGRDGMLAFIEDTPGRWFKAASPVEAEIDVLDVAEG